MSCQAPGDTLPTFQDRKAMWASIKFPPVESEYPAIAEFLKAVRSLYSNGTAEHAAFAIPEHPIFDWYSQRNQFHEMGFFQHFWTCPGPRERLPHSIHDLNFFDQKVFSSSSSFVLGGLLAWQLAFGGAYNSFPMSGAVAKQLGEAAALEMLGGNYDIPAVFECGSAWSEFFCDVAWDHTFVVIDSRRRIVHALLSTDTD